MDSTDAELDAYSILGLRFVSYGPPQGMTNADQRPLMGRYTATAEDGRSAMRVLAKQCHPDRCGVLERPISGLVFSDLTAAVARLADPNCMSKQCCEPGLPSCCAD